PPLAGNRVKPSLRGTRRAADQSGPSRRGESREDCRMTNSLIRKEIDAMNHERPHGRNENEDQHSHNPAPAGEVTPEFARGEKARIYVGSVADYNAGRLHGAWIDATQDPEQIQADIASMLERSHEPLAEEWAIHDYEGFCGTDFSEYESVERVSRI